MTHIILFIILLLCLINTMLLMKHMHKCDKYMKHPNNGTKENYFPVSDTDTSYNPYDGVTFCSAWGKRNVHNKNIPIGDDSAIFYGKDIYPKNK